MKSGYTPCACRDCFETTISGGVTNPDLCDVCAAHGCDGGECAAPSVDREEDMPNQIVWHTDNRDM